MLYLKCVSNRSKSVAEKRHVWPFLDFRPLPLPEDSKIAKMPQKRYKSVLNYFVIIYEYILPDS